MACKKTNNSESGAVAILSVIFFMILLSVIVISFVRLVVHENQQTLDNELSASALAAAQGGVEDGKRVLVYCATTTTSQAECQAALNNTENCNVITGVDAIVNGTPLNIEQRAGSGALEGVIDNASGQYLQRYTCLQISTETDDVSGIKIVPGRSEVIPLKVVGDDVVSSVTFRWHAVAADLDGDPGDICTTVSAGTTKFTQDTAWYQTATCGGRTANSSLTYPDVMRLELVTVPKAGFTLDQITADARAVTLVPSWNASTSVFDMNLYPPSDVANTGISQPPMRDARCRHDSSPYACEVTFTRGGGLDVANNDYYLRISATYRSSGSDSQVTLSDNRKFDNVQPIIDVTGRANDAFRRLQARVRLNAAGTFVPEYAIESGSKVCKDMFVTSDPASSSDKCDGYLADNQ